MFNATRFSTERTLKKIIHASEKTRNAESNLYSTPVSCCANMLRATGAKGGVCRFKRRPRS
jgi:hypothetical protein